MNINGTFPPVSLAGAFNPSAGNAPYVVDEEVMKIYEPALNVAYIGYQCLLGQVFHSGNPVAMVAKGLVTPVTDEIFGMAATHLAISKDDLVIPHTILLNVLSYKVPNLIDKRYTFKNHLKHTALDFALMAIGAAILYASTRAN